MVRRIRRRGRFRFSQSTVSQARALRNWLLPGIALVASAVLLVTLYAIFDRMIERIPEGRTLTSLAVTVGPSQEVTIGRHELLQPPGSTSAAERHLRIRRQDGEWFVADVAGLRRAFLDFEGFGSTFGKRWLLQTGDILSMPGATITFTRVDHKSRVIELEVKRAKGTSHYVLQAPNSNQGHLIPSEPPSGAWFDDCEERAPFVGRFLSLRNFLIGQMESFGLAETILRRSAERPKLLIGGVISCGGKVDVPQLAVEDSAPREVILSERNGRFFVGPGSSAALVSIKRGFCELQGFQDVDWPVQGVPKTARECITHEPLGALRSVVLGRTRYKVEVAGDTMTFTPTVNLPVIQASTAEREAPQFRPPPEFVRQTVAPMPDRAAWRDPLGILLTDAIGSSIWSVLFLFPVAVVIGLTVLRRVDAYRLTLVSTGSLRQEKLASLARTILLVSALVLTISVVFLVTQAADVHPMGPVTLLLLDYGVASLAVGLFARGNVWLVVFWHLVMLLVGFGLLTLAQLGYGGDNSRLLDFFRSQMVVFAILPPLVVMAASVRLPVLKLLMAPFVVQSVSPGRVAGVLGLHRGWRRRLRLSDFVVKPVLLIARWLLTVGWVLALVALALAVVTFILFGLVAMVGLGSILPGPSTTAWAYFGYALFSFATLALLYLLPNVLFSLKILPLVGLTFVFLAWFALGGEEGLGPFQPAELGKFAAVCFMSLLLIAVARRQDAIDPVVSFGVVLVYVFAVLFYLFLFVAIPALKSDFSPILIIGTTSVVLVIIAGFVPLMRILVGRWATRAGWKSIFPRELFGGGETLAAPTHLPSFRGKKIVLTLGQRSFSVNWIAPVFRLLVVGAVMALSYFVSSSVLRPVFLTSYEDARHTLEPHLAGGLGVLAQRALSYRDLDYDRPPRKDANGRDERVVDYRDLGLQVVASRRAIAEAPCYSIGDLSGDLRRFAVVRLLYGASPEAPAEAVAAVETPAPAEAAPVPAAAAEKPLELPAGTFMGLPCRTAAQAPPFGPNSDTVMRIPALEDDFAGAFFINRFGVEAGLAMALVQVLFVAMLLIGALRVRRHTSRDRIEEAMRSLMFGVCIGAAVLFTLHWSISWANLFGLLPVMGQPMTFVSLGGSHLSLMAFPLIVVSILAMRVGHEQVGVRSVYAPPDPQIRRAVGASRAAVRRAAASA